MNDENSILLICDDKANAYASISKIVSGYDKFISLRQGDAIVFAEPRYDANEKTIVKLENDLAMAGCKISIQYATAVITVSEIEDGFIPCFSS